MMFARFGIDAGSVKPFSSGGGEECRERRPSQ
jgi:hypothetical protein